MKKTIYQIIFEADTPIGKLFDIILILMIILSIGLTMLDSVQDYNLRFGSYFTYLEYIITFFFSLEYVLRIYCSPKRSGYVLSFYGLIDLVSILPLFLSFFFPAAQGLALIRGLRVLRIFRVLKLTMYTKASSHLYGSLKNSWPKISVFLLTIMTAVFIIGGLMYLIEGRANGFTSIPKSIYWAVVTMTTVGYGDMVPKTDLGQFVSIVLMILGYGVIAVPTGIVSSEMLNYGKSDDLKTCGTCSSSGHRDDSSFCFKCGSKI
tara:strand:- start:296 stop:1084 length:789 start_codon:yes stop_codon:yes gene_type:complete